MEKKRPKGIIIIGSYLLLCTIPAVVAAIIGGISSSEVKTTPEIALDVIMHILFITSPVALLVIAIGLLRLRNWARILTMIFFPIVMYITCFGVYIIFGLPPIPTLVISVAIFVFVIYYLTRPIVKEYFKK